MSRLLHVPLTIALLFIIVFSLPVMAASVADKLVVPEAGVTQILTLEDGSSLVGRITEVGDSEIKFQSELGETTIAIDKIRKIETAASSRFKDGKYWFSNPNRTRLYVGPSGRCLRQGEGYLTDIYLFFPGVAYGITDNISIGGGMSLFPGLDPGEQLFYFTPKVGVSSGDGIDIAMTALLVRIPDGGDDEVIVGVLFGTATMGSEDRSLSLGVGYGFADGEFADKPAVMIGGETRVARRMALVSENWIFPGVDVPVISYGVRFFGEKMAVDLALFNVLDDDAIFPGIPYIDFVWNF